MTGKKSIALMLAVLMTLGVFQCAGAAASEEAPDHLVINQIYGGGGKGGTPFSHSFIELYNPSSREIDLTGCQITYSSNRDQSKKQHLGSTDGETVTKELTGKIPAKCSYLIRGAAEETDSLRYRLDAFDLDWSGRFIDNDQTVVITLLSAAGVQIDGISTRTDGFEDIGEGASPTTVDISKQKSLRRINFQDTGDNAADFALLTWNDAAVDDAFISAYRPRSLGDGAWDNADVPEVPPGPSYPGSMQTGINGKLTHIADYKTGASSSDGGAAEIVKYNTDNQKMYVVSGFSNSIRIVSLAPLGEAEASQATLTGLKEEALVDFKALGAEHGFNAGDITSIDVNTKYKVVAVAVQPEDFKENGCIVLLGYDGGYISHFPAGSEPDMITFTPDGNYALTADEGEPRDGYTDGTTDPKGSVTVLDLTEGVEQASVQTIDFTAFDGRRGELVEKGVLLKPDTLPSTDLEPEYIAVSEDSRYAYVSLQEANAVAVLDLSSMEFTELAGLGFKDHSLEQNALDALKDGKAELKTQSLCGVYMPDGIAAVTIGGNQYFLTANEGDAREWGDYSDTGKITIDGCKVETLLNSERDGLDGDKTYLYGGRSFSIYSAETMEQVYDSGSDFERITAGLYPTVFNSSNDKTGLDSRSGKKGPEPEDVKTLKAGNKTYAVVGLERIGGVMLYDISDVENVKFSDYINMRDFAGTSLSTGGALGPEGLCTIEASASPTGKPLILVANEISGDVNVVSLDGEKEVPAQSVQLDKTELILESGAAEKLTASVTPADTTDAVVFSSSDGETAEVSQDGTVLAKKPGTALITVTAGGASDTCSVAVYKKGDTDSNGAVSVADVLEIQKHLALVTRLDGVQVLAADVNGDRQVTLADVLRIQNFLVGVVPEL